MNVRKKDDNAHIKNQLRGAECFSAYCAKILKIFWNYTMAWKQYNKHYVCFKYTNSVARSTRNDSKAPANTTIDKMLTLEGSHTFQYNQLIGRKAIKIGNHAIIAKTIQKTISLSVGAITFPLFLQLSHITILR